MGLCAVHGEGEGEDVPVRSSPHAFWGIMELIGKG